jgi:hypothetical protein
MVTRENLLALQTSINANLLDFFGIGKTILILIRKTYKPPINVVVTISKIISTPPSFLLIKSNK